MDLGLERLKDASLRHPPIARRPVAPQAPADRVARQYGRPGQLLDRLAADEVLAPQLGPPLPRTPPPAAPPSSWTTSLGTAPDVSASRERGSNFARRRGSVSCGADTLAPVRAIGRSSSLALHR